MGVGARSLNLTPESLGEAKLPDIPSVASSIGILFRWIAPVASLRKRDDNIPRLR